MYEVSWVFGRRRRKGLVALGKVVSALVGGPGKVRGAGVWKDTGHPLRPCACFGMKSTTNMIRSTYRPIRTSLLLAALVTSGLVIGQDEKSDRTDDTLGFRRKLNGKAIIAYANGPDDKPNIGSTITVNHRIYVQPVLCKTCVVPFGPGDTLVKVFVPGVPCIAPPEPTSVTKGVNEAYQKQPVSEHFQVCHECKELNARKSVELTRCQYGQCIWLLESDLKDMAPEFVRGRNVPTIGLLTLPWVYRFERGEKPPILDGGFSLSAAFGWKFRVSSKQKMSLFPVIAPGYRALNYTAANNTSVAGDSTDSGGAITLAGGLIFEWNKKQIGFLVGTDAPLNDNGEHYVYGGAPWIAFTIGYDLFTSDSDAKGPVNP